MRLIPIVIAIIRVYKFLLYLPGDQFHSCNNVGRLHSNWTCGFQELFCSFLKSFGLVSREYNLCMLVIHSKWLHVFLAKLLLH